MINAKLIKGERCSIDPGAVIGYKEHGGFIRIGDFVSIRFNTVLRTCGGKIIIGNRVVINYGCVFHGLGGINIGNNVLLSPYVQLYAQNHGIEKGIFIRKQRQTGKGIRIEDDVWVGAGSIILDGVTVHKGAIIGANSVVSKDIPEFEIWAGTPATKIGIRP